jgi:DNA helicase II / ATP-dependent DNA helicase PcrA
MNLLEDLNPTQREAVTTVEGPLLVHAGPGSGKTRVIVHRIAYMVNVAKIKPSHILAVTFSKKASEEMKKRLEELLGSVASLLTVSTIHSACLRILRSEGVPGLGVNFEIFDDESQGKLIKKCIENAGLDPEDSDLRRFKGIISYSKINMIDPESIVARPGERMDDTAAAIYRSYQKGLKRKRALDYDDMLIQTYKLFRENDTALKKYQRRYKYILVDEFQDTSSMQYRIIKQLGGMYRNVCVVGDPDQTIYSWRQAEIQNIDHFRKDFPGTKIIGMAENFRSTRTIVDAANAVISRNKRRTEKTLTTSREQGDRISVIKLPDHDEEARFIARTIKSVSKECSLKYSDFTVLYRVNTQSRILEDAFNSESIPYKLTTGIPFYKRKEIMDITSWLRVMRNTSDDAALVRVIKIAGKGIGEQTISNLQAYAEKTGNHFYQVLQQASTIGLPELTIRPQRAIARFLALVDKLRSEGKHMSMVLLTNQIIERTSYQEHLKSQDDPEERWENVLEFISLATYYEHLSPNEALASLIQKIGTAEASAESGQAIETVNFNTLHGSKGTEFPVVFIAGVEEGLLPHGKSLDDADKLEEERRLFYVGITRAIDQVYLTHAEKRFSFGATSFNAPSRFIYEIPANLVNNIGIANTENSL